MAESASQSMSDPTRVRRPPATKPPPSAADFSTRFLATDGIPTYNALLDTHLGKRREFLLGNKRSLQHLQRTGAIARVEEKPENPSQYVVFMHEPKPSGAMPQAAAAAAAAIRRAPTLSHALYNRTSTPAFKSVVARSESTPQLALQSSSGPKSGRRRPRQQQRHDNDATSTDDDDSDNSDRDVSNHRHGRASGGASAGASAGFGRSASTTALPLRSSPASPSTVIDRLRRRRSAHGEAGTATAPARSTVERLLESDAAYQLKLQILRDEMHVLEREKQYFAQQIATMRKRLRGVNAVHENDVAVAHCAAIMHARIVKGEEEFMKLVTAQQHVKRDIDALRRELLAMRKVEKKLVDDIRDVEAAHASVADKIRTAKGVRNVLSQELVELERRAELAAEEQRLKLPPEEDVVVDAHELMSSVQHQQQRAATSVGRRTRRSTVVLTAGSPLENLQRLLSEKAIVSDVAVSEKPLLSFRRAFRVIQQTLASEGGTDHDENHIDGGGASALDRFVTQFEETEDALLSKHKLNAQLQDEVDQLEREAATLTHEATQRYAQTRGAQHAASALQQQLHDKIQHALQRIDTVNELRDVRNYEHTRLRAIMQRCLELLHVEKVVVGTHEASGLGGPLLLSELSSPAMLEALQKKMTEVAITLKLQHNAKSDDVGSESTSRPSSAGDRDRHASVVGGNSNTSNNGRGSRPNSATRRSNLLLKRDTGASKIVLGPREPSGAALKAIRITAQPPTVDGAQILSETYAAGMHALHPTIVSATPKPTRAPRKLTISRMASIRAGKRVSALMTSGSSRRISAPATTGDTATTMATATTVASTRPSRVSMMWPMRGSTKDAKLLSGSSSDSLQLTGDDTRARVVENPDDELES